MLLPPDALRQGGRFSYQQARAAGLTIRQLRRAVRDGELLEVGYGVYAAVVAASHPAEVQANLVRNVQLARREKWFAARRTAAILMALPIIGRPPLVAQMVRAGSRQGAQGTSRHLRISPVPESDIWEYRGIAMTTPARTVVDIARAEPFRNALVVADAALRRGVPHEELRDQVGRMSRWPRIAQARRVVNAANGLAESPGESITRAALPPGITAIPQVNIYLRGTFVARPDLLIERELLAVEFDGAIKFTDAQVLPELLLRQELIRQAGIDVLRVFWDEAFGNPTAFRERLLTRLAERGPQQLPPGVELRPSTLRPVEPLLVPLGDLAA